MTSTLLVDAIIEKRRRRFYWKLIRCHYGYQKVLWRGSCFPCIRTPEATDLLQYSIHKALQDWDAVNQISCLFHSQILGFLAWI